MYVDVAVFLHVTEMRHTADDIVGRRNVFPAPSRKLVIKNGGMGTEWEIDCY